MAFFFLNGEPYGAEAFPKGYAKEVFRLSDVKLK